MERFSFVLGLLKLLENVSSGWSLSEFVKGSLTNFNHLLVVTRFVSLSWILALVGFVTLGSRG